MISKRENTRKALDGSWYFLFLETFIAIANALKTDANSLLVDVLDVSTLIEASSVAEKISALPTAEQRRITHLLSVMVDDVIADYQ